MTIESVVWILSILGTMVWALILYWIDYRRDDRNWREFWAFEMKDLLPPNGNEQYEGE